MSKQQTECPMCIPDGKYWSTEDQAFVDCSYCGGSQLVTATKREPNSFERFVLHNRPICEVDLCMKPSVRVLSLYKNPVAVCESHFQQQNAGTELEHK